MKRKYLHFAFHIIYLYPYSELFPELFWYLLVIASIILFSTFVGVNCFIFRGYDINWRYNIYMASGNQLFRYDYQNESFIQIKME